MIHWRWLLIGVVVFFLTPVRAGDEFEPTETREFEVLADGRPVGVHVMRIREEGPQATVVMKSDVQVKVLLYRYIYVFDSKETWDGERLMSFDSMTSDNGKKTRVQLKRDTEHSLIQFRQQRDKIQHPHQTTAYSRLPPGIEETRTLRLLNLDDGVVVSTTWSPEEVEKIPLDDRSIRCRRWVVGDGLNAELWFDDSGWLVRQRTLERGHRSELRLTSIRREQVKP